MSERGKKQNASEADLDLAKAAAAQRPDPDLAQLAGMAEGGGGPVLALLVSGTIVVGRLVDDSAMDEAINQHISAVFALIAQKSEDPEQLSNQAEELVQQRREATEKHREEKVQLMERYEAEVGEQDLQLAEMPADLARDLISDRARVNLTLADANVLLPGSRNPLTVPLMRVDVRQVGGWWIVPTDPETGSASFTYPG